MTTTTATAKLRFIPTEGKGVEQAIGTTTVVAFYVNAAGWTVQARRDGVTIHANTQPVERIAVDLFNQLVEQYEAEQPAEQPAKVEAIPGNVGTTMRVSDPSHTVLALAATAHDGIVEQGGKLGQATVTQLRSLANKGYLTLFPKKGGTPYSIGGGRITEKGRKRLAEITKADADAAEKAARLAVIDTIRIAA